MLCHSPLHQQHLDTLAIDLLKQYKTPNSISVENRNIQERYMLQGIQFENFDGN